MAQIIPTAEPFFFPASTEVGVLLVHGFTGAPKEMRWMGEYLHQQGFTVLGLRLSGHATQPEDMLRSSYSDWLASVEDGYRLLSGAVKNIYMMGLSMGGVLTLTTAAYLPPHGTGTSPPESTGASPVKGLVAMSTPYSLPPDPRLRHIEWISKAVPFMPKGTEEPGSGWFDKEAYKEQISYPLNPIRSAAELEVLLANMRAALPNVTVPVCMIHSKNDVYIVPENMEQIYAGLVNATDKSKHYVTESGHVVTRDAARGQVFEIARDFIKRVEGM